MKAKYMYVNILAGFLGLFACISNANNVEIQVSNAWIPEAPPAVSMMAGYFNLENGSSKTITLVGVSSPSFGKVELHRTEITEGMARMVRQDRVQVPPDGALLLEPGSYHLMLMKPVEPLKEGNTVELQLQFDDGQKLDVTALVKVRP